ncbi:hypothetical protein RIF29_19439 [Crotalaria pallida]|uniref:Uncharacterized protein n=1 Tax=Crotalaria pallida TaxID=3830 RepID=A0AAN9I6I3_CROPI
MEIVEKKMMVKYDVENKKGEVMREKVVKNTDANEKSKVIRDDAINAQNFLFQTKIEDDIQDGGEASGNGGVVVGDTKAEKFMDFLSTDIAEKSDQFPSLNEFRFQAEQNFDYYYPFWETQDGAYSFWNVEPSTNDWAISLGQL